MSISHTSSFYKIKETIFYKNRYELFCKHYNIILDYHNLETSKGILDIYELYDINTIEGKVIMSLHKLYNMYIPYEYICKTIIIFNIYKLKYRRDVYTSLENYCMESKKYPNIFEEKPLKEYIYINENTKNQINKIKETKYYKYNYKIFIDCYKDIRDFYYDGCKKGIFNLNESYDEYTVYGRFYTSLKKLSNMTIPEKYGRFIYMILNIYNLPIFEKSLEEYSIIYEKDLTKVKYYKDNYELFNKHYNIVINYHNEYGYPVFVERYITTTNKIKQTYLDSIYTLHNINIPFVYMKEIEKILSFFGKSINETSLENDTIKHMKS